MGYFKTALVGLGRMGRNHLNAILDSTEFELVAVVEPGSSSEKIPETYTQASPRYLDSIDQLSPNEIDCAIVASPTETHFEVVKSLLSKGIHVLVEKPAASTSEQASVLAEQASNLELKLAVGNIERCNSAISKLKYVLSSGLVGNPIHISSTRGGPFPPAVKPGNNVILDLAVHDLDIFQLLLGPLQVLAATGHCTTLSGIIDTADITTKSQDGITASCHVNWHSPHKLRTIRITGTRSVCELDMISKTCSVYSSQAIELSNPDHPYSTIENPNCFQVNYEVEARDALRYQLGQWSRLLKGQDHVLATEQELIDSVRLANEAISLIPSATELHLQHGSWQPAYSHDQTPIN